MGSGGMRGGGKEREKEEEDVKGREGMREIKGEN